VVSATPFEDDGLGVDYAKGNYNTELAVE